MPTAYAVTYIFGTIGSAIVIAMLRPYSVAHRLEEGGQRVRGDAWRQARVRRAWRRVASVRRARIPDRTGRASRRQDGERDRSACSRRLRRVWGTGCTSWPCAEARTINEATSDLVLQAGDIVSVVGRARSSDRAARPGQSRRLTIPSCSRRRSRASTSTSPTKRPMVRRWQSSGALPGARGVYVRRIKRGFTETPIPVLGDTKLYRGDVVTLVGRTQDTSVAARRSASSIAPTDVTDVAFIGIAITIGALIGAIVIKVAGVPITLSTAGGALIMGIVAGWYRATRPDLRSHSDADALVHELGRSQHVHRSDRPHGRSKVRCRTATARLRPLLMGSRRNDRAADSWDVSRKVRLPLPRRDHVWARSRERERRRRRSACSPTPRRAKCRALATPSPMRSATPY